MKRLNSSFDFRRIEELKVEEDKQYRYNITKKLLEKYKPKHGRNSVEERHLRSEEKGAA